VVAADSIDVVVPTFRRPADLARCLRGLAAQALQPAHVVVVVRCGDDDSARIASQHGAETVWVQAPGVVAAMTAGVARTTSPLVAITDDDAVPRPEWLAGLSRHLEDPSVGAAGGRDIVEGDEATNDKPVGAVTWWGRHAGNHHRGTGSARDVSVLKGVSMLVRAEAFAFPPPRLLQGDGAEVHLEIVTCTSLRLQGLRVVYDPQVIVEHYPGVRHDDDARGRQSARATRNAAYNLVIGTSASHPRRRPLHVFAGLLFGERDAPGLVRTVVALVRREQDVVSRFMPSARGRASALWRWRMRPTGLVYPRAPAAPA